MNSFDPALNYYQFLFRAMDHRVGFFAVSLFTVYGADCFSKLPTPLADRRFAVESPSSRTSRGPAAAGPGFGRPAVG